MMTELYIIYFVGVLVTFILSLWCISRYEFAAIKKDGGVSLNNVYPQKDYEWTGEIHKDFK